MSPKRFIHGTNFNKIANQQKKNGHGLENTEQSLDIIQQKFWPNEHFNERTLFGTMNQKQNEEKEEKKTSAWNFVEQQTHTPNGCVTSNDLAEFLARNEPLRAAKSLKMSLVYMCKVRIWTFLLRL